MLVFSHAIVCWFVGWWYTGCLIGWTARFSDFDVVGVSWLLGWLVGGLVGWLAVWLAGWLASSLGHWLLGCLVGWLAGSLVGWLVAWFPEAYLQLFC